MGTEFGLSGVMGRGLLGYMRFSCNSQGGGAVWTGRYLLRHLWLLMVILPDPSIRIICCSNCLTSTTIPILSHCMGYGLVWSGSGF